MRQYNFDTLNSTDLEHLVLDLLNADEKANKKAISYSSFPVGKDQGIDLLKKGQEIKTIIILRIVFNIFYLLFF